MSAAKSDFDLIIAGGGIAGSSLAIVMARAGYRVLLVERERQFRDRIRGELLLAWGSREAKSLGIYDDLVATCALEAPFWSYFIGGQLVRVRDVKATTADGVCCLTLPHPLMQESLITLAEAAGVRVVRGIALADVMPGATPSVSLLLDGAERRLTARLVVVAEGRESRLRNALKFDVKADPEFILIGGMLMRGANEIGWRIDDDAARSVHSLYDPATLRFVIAITVADHLSRVYLIHHKDVLPRRLSGARDFGTAIDHLRAVGAPQHWFDAAELAGPFSTFDGAARWVDHPYRDGIALIGDAAGASDPTWGEGLARTLRDIRLLRDRLLADDDWDRAGHAYAEDHDAFFARMLSFAAMRGTLMFERGPEADARRGRAFAAQKADPTRVPDTLDLGPDAACDDVARARYFGEA